MAAGEGRPTDRLAPGFKDPVCADYRLRISGIGTTSRQDCMPDGIRTHDGAPGLSVPHLRRGKGPVGSPTLVSPGAGTEDERIPASVRLQQGCVCVCQQPLPQESYARSARRVRGRPACSSGRSPARSSTGPRRGDLEGRRARADQAAAVPPHLRHADAREARLLARGDRRLRRPQLGRA